MTDLQKLEIRAADIRQRLAAIGGMDELTDEIRSEMDALRGEYTDVETKQIALKISSDIPEPIITSTAEGREYGQLITRSNIGEIFDASISHKPLVGATGELQTHLGLELNQIPLAMLQRQPLETRAVTPAPGNVGVNQGPILMYVFPDSAAAFLDVAMPTVGVGEALSWISQIELNSLNMRPSGMERTIKLHTEPVNGHAIRSTPPLSWRNHLLTSLKVRNPRPLPKRLPRGGLFVLNDPITLSPIPSLPEWTILAPAEAG